MMHVSVGKRRALGKVVGKGKGNTDLAFAEVYAKCKVTDLGEYGLGRAVGGSGSAVQQWSIPAGNEIQEGTFLYIANDQASFEAFFQKSATYVSPAVDNDGTDGTDALELYHHGTVIDRFGDPDGVPATAVSSWFFTHGWGYRRCGTDAHADGWDVRMFDFTEITHDCSSHGSCSQPMPNAVLCWCNRQHSTSCVLSCSCR
jgi:hypothetical protein